MHQPSYTPRRIVSLQPSVTVTIRDLGALDRVVACTKYCADVCPEIRDRKPLIVSDSWSAQAEEILAAQPDLVIACVPYQLEAVAEILKAGIRFLGLAPRTLKDIYADIMLIAGTVGEHVAGAHTVSHMRDAIAEVTDRTRKISHKPRVFCEEWGKPLIASQAWVAELVAAAGGSFFGLPGKTVTPEEVAQAKPDVLLAAWCGAGDRVPLEKMVKQRGWQGFDAVLTRRVYCISDGLLNTPASNLIDGLRAIAWALHPDLFPQVPGIRRIQAVIK